MSDVAKFFGVRDDTVRQDWAPRGMPGTKGHYDIQEILKWKLQRERDKERPDSGKSATDLLKIEQARKTKLQADTLEGLLVPRDDILREWNEGVLAVRTRLEQIPDEYSLELREDDRPRLTQRLRDLLHLALKELARWKMPSTDVDSNATDDEHPAD